MRLCINVILSDFRRKRINIQISGKTYPSYTCILAMPGVRGGSRISGKGVRMYKGMGVSFADFVSFILNIP